MASKDIHLQEMLAQYKHWFSKFYKTTSYAFLDNDGEILHCKSSAGKFPISPKAESWKDSNAIFRNSKKENFESQRSQRI